MVNRLKEDLVETSSFGRTPARKVETYDQLDPQTGVTRPAGTVQVRSGHYGALISLPEKKAPKQIRAP